MNNIDLLEQQIDDILNKHEANSTEYLTLQHLHNLLGVFALKRTPETAKKAMREVKHYIGSHADNPALHKDMRATTGIFFTIISKIYNEVRAEGAGEGDSPTLQEATHEVA
jgi:hypothetical protein